MTAFPWSTATDEIEHVQPVGEPSHVHIPRPSRQRQGHVADTSFEELVLGPGGCGCAED